MALEYCSGPVKKTLLAAMRLHGASDVDIKAARVILGDQLEASFIERWGTSPNPLTFMYMYIEKMSPEEQIAFWKRVKSHRTEY